MRKTEIRPKVKLSYAKRKQIRDVALKALHRKGSSKKAKTERGSALGGENR
jgi:hypothetical protein